MTMRTASASDIAVFVRPSVPRQDGSVSVRARQSNVSKHAVPLSVEWHCSRRGVAFLFGQLIDFVKIG
ncbi:MAG: hypothetical protein JWN24_2476 [Phycisphaerales bacterium]|nr:hypothetical protein [Phycisphaerales bacterium]